MPKYEFMCITSCYAENEKEARKWLDGIISRTKNGDDFVIRSIS